MNKDEYFEISKKKNLPLRCPILNYCSRRAITICFNSNYEKYEPGLSCQDALIKDGTLPRDFKSKRVDLQGEKPIWMPRSTGYFFEGMCPEVNLFDSSISLACVSADYDKENAPPKVQVIESKHFSECPEFNFYVFEKRRNISRTKPRKSIPNKTRSILQKEIKSQCPFCPNEDVEHFQVHHIDKNPMNNELENLLMLCPTCHSKITKGDIKYDSVIKVKSQLTK